MPMLSKAKDASVVFTSDRHGREPRPFGGAYSISKAGIEQLAQMWAAELQSNKNLRINSYNPGTMRTSVRIKGYAGELPAASPLPETATPVLMWKIGRASGRESVRQYV